MCSVLTPLRSRTTERNCPRLFPPPYFLGSACRRQQAPFASDKAGQAEPGRLHHLVSRFQAQERATNRLERFWPDDYVLIDLMHVSEEAIEGMGGIDSRAA